MELKSGISMIGEIVSYVNLNNVFEPIPDSTTKLLVDSQIVAGIAGVVKMAPDFSSILDIFILKASKVVYIGGTVNENKDFIDKMHTRYTCISHYGLNGYGKWDEYDKFIKARKPDLVILSLGFPLQEKLAEYLRANSLETTIVCCGALISQESKESSLDYYPSCVVELNIRWLYRLFYEQNARVRFHRIVLNAIALYWLSLIRRVKRH